MAFLPLLRNFDALPLPSGPQFRKLTFRNSFGLIFLSPTCSPFLQRPLGISSFSPPRRGWSRCPFLKSFPLFSPSPFFFFFLFCCFAYDLSLSQLCLSVVVGHRRPPPLSGNPPAPASYLGLFSGPTFLKQLLLPHFPSELLDGAPTLSPLGDDS